MITSDNLKTIQTLLEATIASEFTNNPMTDYNAVNFLSEITEKIDNFRRKTWHDEKFGDYEKLFCSDDIPF